MTIVDLFCGCGGFSAGFSEAGYSIALANDIDNNCAETYKSNHSKSTIFLEKDLKKINDKNTQL